MHAGEVRLVGGPCSTHSGADTAQKEKSPPYGGLISQRP
jgi:hypothetical protein